MVTQLQAAYRVVDANSNGSLTFEEFLVGFSLLDAAGVQWVEGGGKGRGRGRGLHS